MKVTQVRTRTLSIPFQEPYFYSQGCALGINSLLVEVETDDGIAGIGEACGDRSALAAAGVVQSAARCLVGYSPHDVEAFLHRFYRLAKWDDMRRFAHQALAGVEMALWDIIGKAADQPVHRLLGGACRERISCFGFLQGDEPDKLAADARVWRDRGFEVLYVKVGRTSDRDRACVAAVREAAGPGARIRVDANQAWTAGEAVQRLCDLAEFDIDFAEQPVHWSDLDGLARVRAAVPMPVAVDQGVFTDAEVLEVIRKQAADVIVLGLHEAGGLLNMKKAAAVAAAGELPLCRHGVMGETGISTLASCQILAAIPNCTDGHQVMHQLLAHDVVAGGVPDFEDGHLPVSTAPGLGVELDRDAVEEAAQRCERDGPYWPF